MASKCNRDALAVMANRSRNCTDYSSAREIVFFKVDVKYDANGQPFVQSVYTNDILKLGKGMPDSSQFNIEHTWPQSKLKQYARFSETKSDMHHLFAVQSRANSVRGNAPFRDIPGEPSGQGRIPETDGSSYEPPEQHKGIVARAMFYMAVAYDMSIDAEQERTLREWNDRFPVSADELERARRVEANQGNINPFVENPEYVSLVTDF
jgi:endonuclease I